jgi:hypothetical protein
MTHPKRRTQAPQTPEGSDSSESRHDGEFEHYDPAKDPKYPEYEPPKILAPLKPQWEGNLDMNLVTQLNGAQSTLTEEQRRALRQQTLSTTKARMTKEELAEARKPANRALAAHWAEKRAKRKRAEEAAAEASNQQAGPSTETSETPPKPRVTWGSQAKRKRAEEAAAEASNQQAGSSEQRQEKAMQPARNVLAKQPAKEKLETGTTEAKLQHTTQAHFPPLGAGGINIVHPAMPGNNAQSSPQRATRQDRIDMVREHLQREHRRDAEHNRGRGGQTDDWGHEY